MKRKLLLVLLFSAAVLHAQDVIYYPSGGAPPGGGAWDSGVNGIVVRTAPSTAVSRTITSTSLIVQNGDGVAGNLTVDLDGAVTPSFTSGTATVSGNCSVGQFYFETDANLLSGCTATNTWRTFVSTSDSTRSANSLTSIDIVEDFLTGVGSTSGQAGWWGPLISAVATGVATEIPGVYPHVGIMRLASNVSNDNSGALVAMGNTVGLPWGTSWDSTDWTIDVIFQPGSNSTAITNTDTEIGLTSASAFPISGATNGIYIRHDSDASDATFKFIVCNAAGAAGCTGTADGANIKIENSTITPVAGTWYRFRIRHLVAGGPGATRLVGFRVNDETEVTFCSSGCTDTLGTVPSGTALRPDVQYLTRTTTGTMSGDLDYFAITMSGIAARY